MQNLAVLCHDCGERHTLTIRLCDALNTTSNLALHNTWATHLHRCHVHLVANLECALQSLDLLCRLLLAHLSYGEHQIQRLALVEHAEADAEPVGNLNLELCTIGRQVVHGAVLLDSLAQYIANSVAGVALLHAYLASLVSDCGHGACPDDILHREVITEEHRLTRLCIDKTDERGYIQAEVVAECRVLTVVVCVIRIVVRHLGVCGEKDKSLAYAARQLGTTANISLFAEHSFIVLGNLYYFRYQFLREFKEIREIREINEFKDTTLNSLNSLNSLNYLATSL